jgi:hypothetical protein
MKEIDPITLLEPGTRLDQLLAEIVNPALPARRVPGVARVEVECFGSTKKSAHYVQRVTDEDRRLTSGYYGRLLVRKLRFTRRWAERRYWGRCDCGREVWLTAWQLRWRRRLDVGCLQPGCSAAPAHFRPWYDPVYALRLQHWQLLRAYPELTENDWGGVLAETLPPALELDGLVTFLQFMLPKVDLPGRNWWVRRENPMAAFTMDNLTTGTTPDPELMQGLLALYIEDLEAGVLPDMTDAMIDYPMETLIGDTPMTMAEHKVTVVRPGDPAYQAFSQMVTGPDAPAVKRFDYDTFAAEYNNAPVDSFLVMSNTYAVKLSNIHHVLTNRGVLKEVDYHMDRPIRDPEGKTLPRERRNVVIQKLTEQRIALKRDL